MEMMKFGVCVSMGCSIRDCGGEYAKVGDFACSDGVDEEDLAMMAVEWMYDDDGSYYADGNFDGLVDMSDFKVVSEHWKYEGQEIDVDLAAWWKLDGDVSESQSSLAAVMNGEPEWVADGADYFAIELDGVNDYLTSPFVIDPAGGAFSVFAWVKNGDACQVILSQSDTGVGSEAGRMWLSVDGSGVLKTAIREPGGRGLLSTVSEVCDGQWHHVGLVFDGSLRKLYF